MRTSPSERALLKAADPDLSRSEEELTRSASVHMQFLVGLPVASRHIDTLGREHSWDGCRCHEHADEQRSASRVVASRYGSEIPDHRALGVDVGRLDEQPASELVLSCYESKELVRHERG